MNRILCALLFTAAVSTVATAKGFTGNKVTATQDCAKEPEGSISGNGNTITFTGACTKISVMGNDNTVIVAAAKEVAVMGNTNRITVGETDSIKAMGNKNQVSW